MDSPYFDAVKKLYGTNGSKTIQVSKCCKASVNVVGKTTYYYVCTICRKPTDVVEAENKIQGDVKN